MDTKKISFYAPAHGWLITAVGLTCPSVAVPRRMDRAAPVRRPGLVGLTCRSAGRPLQSTLKTRAVGHTGKPSRQAHPIQPPGNRPAADTPICPPWHRRRPLAGNGQPLPIVRNPPFYIGFRRKICFLLRS